jgi:hypothetical protein
MKGPDASLWKVGVQDEYNSLIECKVWPYPGSQVARCEDF